MLPWYMTHGFYLVYAKMKLTYRESWRQQVASAIGQKAETERTQETWIAWLAAPGQSAWNCNAY